MKNKNEENKFNFEFENNIENVMFNNNSFEDLKTGLEKLFKSLPFEFDDEDYKNVFDLTCEVYTGLVSLHIDVTIYPDQYDLEKEFKDIVNMLKYFSCAGGYRGTYHYSETAKKKSLTMSFLIEDVFNKKIPHQPRPICLTW